MMESGARIKVCISGLTAVGKTHVAKSVTQLLRAKNISASTLLLDGGLLSGYDSFFPEERRNHFWLNEKAGEFYTQRMANLELDKRIDRLILHHLRRSRRIVVDSLSAPALLDVIHPYICILLTADLDIRSGRAEISSGTLSRDELQKGIKEKDRNTREILQAAWGFELMSLQYCECFDLVLDNTSFDDSNDIRRLEHESKQKTLDIINTALLLYGTQIADPLVSIERSKETLEYFQELVRSNPQVILRAPRGFMGSIMNYQSNRWEDHNNVWLTEKRPNQVG